jgi:hypothetical protein
MSKISGLDKYLTSEPDDGYDSYAERVIEAVDDGFYEFNEAWMSENCADSEFDRLLFFLFYGGENSIQEAAAFIQFVKNHFKFIPEASTKKEMCYDVAGVHVSIKAVYSIFKNQL